MKALFVIIGTFLVVMAGLGLAFIAVTANPPTGSVVQEKDSGEATEGEVKEVRMEMYNHGFRIAGDDLTDGDRVRMTVTSTSGSHGVSIPSLGVQTSPLSPGQEEILEFTAKAGTHQYFCNVYCGSGHSGMRGELVIT